MDFSYSDEQRAILDLADRILADGATHERMKAIERGGGPRFDRALWAEMAQAGLLGVAIPEAYGGGGLGFLEVAGIVEQIGRRTAPVPFLETVVLGALPIARFGNGAQKEAWLPRVARGECVLSAALVEGDEAPEGTVARRDGAGWILTGSKTCVPAGAVADRILVPARTGAGGLGVFLVDPAAPGAERIPLETTSGQPEARLELEGARAESLLGDPEKGSEIVAWIEEHGTAALACLALGVCEEALHMTAEYAKTRKQFDQPIAMFQAVGHRAADAYIDTEAIRLSTLQAAWRLAEGLPAAPQVAVAKYWAADGGQRVVHAAQHLHGGIGVDRDYPLHRYFLYAKQLELTLGGTTPQLLRLGRLIADGAA